MIRNYLTIALRNLRRNLGYTTINLVGLAVGLAACILIGLYVRHELSYDDFHENADRIYRVVQHSQRGESGRSTLMHSARLAPAINANFPSAQRAVRVSTRWGENILVERGDNTFYEDDFLFADSSFFEVFDGFELRRGNPETALSEPFSVVLTEQMAEKYFGDANPIGRTIQAEGFEEMHELTVTGVAENPPSTSHLQFNFLGSFSTLRPSEPDPEAYDSWRHILHYTYVLLDRGHQPTELESTLPRFVLRQRGQSPEELKQEDARFQYELQPITAIHLHADYDRELEAGGDIRYIWIFGTLAALILALACVNYVNLATAQAQRRAREVGVRKTVGAGRGQLVRQYLGESALLCGLALLGALVLARLAVPVFNELAGVQLGAHFFDPTTLGLVLGLGLLVALGAGAYPAFYLSSFRPVQVIEGAATAGVGSARLRRGLVVFQFAIAVALIAGTILIQRQLQYMQTKRLGLNEERVVVVHAREAMYQQYDAFKQELLQQSAISGVTASAHRLPAARSLVSGFLTPEGVDKEKWHRSSHPPIHMLMVDYDFEEVLEIPVVEGRGLSAAIDSAAQSSQPALINRTAAEALGWENPIGKTFEDLRPTPRVVGVVEDFHYQTLRQQIQPLVLIENTYSPRYVMARVQGGDLSQALEAIQTRWQKISDAPFEYSFLDQSFEQAYRAERRMARAFLAFAGLAIVIACLGLLGLAAYATKRREKEIGIRKTLGATATNIVALLSKEFLWLVGLACAIAVPVAYVGMSRWLRDFAYRVDVSPWLFVGASLLALVIALATISVQALRAARTDPATTLRDE